ncbi:hypothetical protein DFH06DRAFT_1341928 [Mycena polygramma]|nr:hypothetical protein DFH06DRAFT_1341928 [Mycena polygramma]
MARRSLSLLLTCLLLVVAAAAHTPTYQRRGPHNARPLYLHSPVHPDVNRTDPQHLRASHGLSLHYHDPHAVFPAIRSFASVHVSAFIHPAIILEHSAYVKSTGCHANTSTITVGFTHHRSAWATAVQDWTKHEQFLLSSFVSTADFFRWGIPFLVVSSYAADAVTIAMNILNDAVDLSAGLGVVMNLKFSNTVSKEKIADIPLSPLAIPGIIVVGPYVRKALARTSIGWTDIEAKVDLKNLESSVDWTRKPAVPLTSLELTGSGTITPAVSMAILFGISAFKKYDLAGGVEVKASLPLTISATVTAETGKSPEFKDCIGVTSELKSTLEVYATVKEGKGSLDVTWLAISPFVFALVDDRKPPTSRRQEDVNRMFKSSKALPVVATAGNYDDRIFYYESKRTTRHI